MGDEGRDTATLEKCTAPPPRGANVTGGHGAADVYSGTGSRGERGPRCPGVLAEGHTHIDRALLRSRLASAGCRGHVRGAAGDDREPDHARPRRASPDAGPGEAGPGCPRAAPARTAASPAVPRRPGRGPAHRRPHPDVPLALR